jgi:hypothetical protein
MIILDRQNMEAVLAEQTLSASAAYFEDDYIRIGNLTNAQYILPCVIMYSWPIFRSPVVLKHTTMTTEKEPGPTPMPVAHGADQSKQLAVRSEQRAISKDSSLLIVI